MVFTDPQAAAVGEADGPLTARPAVGRAADLDLHARLRRRHGFLALVCDGAVLTGAYALGPEAGEWLQQATLAIRARVPLDVMRDTIQPFPTFSESFLFAIEELAKAAS